jgi:hypothetical protein
LELRAVVLEVGAVYPGVAEDGAVADRRPLGDGGCAYWCVEVEVAYYKRFRVPDFDESGRLK